ncbi:MAG: hypothetical protein PHO92_03915 [Candidatus Peribacteraceae bacterium]|nr:hypothetical protein [Candidatus Peribacteraceae bacterium]
MLPILCAAQVGEDLCKKATHNELAKEQRLYRAVLFGEPSATGATLGKVKFDKDGDPWIKVRNETGGKNWASLSGKGEQDKKKSDTEAAQDLGIDPNAASQAPIGTTFSDENGILWIKTFDGWKTALSFQTDEDMEFDRGKSSGTSAELEAKRGIFDTQRTLTSELIPFLVSSMRAFQCRTQYVCATIDASISTVTQSAQLNVPGCLPEERALVPACRFAAEERQESEAARVQRYCILIGNEMLRREADLLKVAVEYDAAYRTILQFAGNFDLSLQELKWPLTFTIRQATGILGQYNRIPCFLGNCDASPIEDQE